MTRRWSIVYVQDMAGYYHKEMDEFPDLECVVCEHVSEDVDEYDYHAKD